MALQKCGLNLSRSRLELQPHGTVSFPCSGYTSEYCDDSDYIIPWHRHEELELIYLVSGKMKVQVPGKTYYLQQGEAIYINSNILHYAITELNGVFHSLVFHSSLITGNDKTVFSQKYLRPLINCEALNSYHITPNLPWEQTILEHFTAAYIAMSLEPAGYEFIVRENLSHIFFALYTQKEHEIRRMDQHLTLDSIRLHKMTELIHEHYNESLTLEQIARSADLGIRECLRCFQRELQISPMQYLIKYRVMQGAALLLEAPDRSVSEISLQCGFDSPSNFSVMFKRYFLCTPRSYRKR